MMKKNFFYLAFLLIALFVASCVKDELVPAEIPEPPVPGELTLMHYWHFNNVAGTVESINADFSVTGGARISYPGTGSGYMDSRTYRPADPVSNLNLRMGQGIDQGAALRVRNPAEGRILLIEAPSTGFTGLIVTYAISRSRPEVGRQQFYYSPNAGASWTAVGDVYDANDMPDWTLVTYDLSEIEAVNNNPDLRFKIEYSGEYINNAEGNSRYDNFTIDGRAMGESNPEKLSILNVNNGVSPEVGKTFSVSLMVTDANGVPSAVDANTTVTLSIESGTGTLGGTISGSIAAGSYDLTLSGVTYDKAETDVIIKATAAGLSEALSMAFTVKAFYALTLVADPAGAGVVSGAGTYEAGQEISLNAVPNAGFEFVNWTSAEGEISAAAAFNFTMPSESVTLTANFKESEIEKELIHYWHFNDLPAGNIVQPDVVNADYSADGLDIGTISYLGDYLDAIDGTDINAQMGKEAGTALRIRAAYGDLIFTVPSNGFQGLEVRMALTRSGSGADTAELFYSADEGATWISVTTFTNVDSSQYTLFSADLSNITAVDNNDKLMLKIFPSGATGGNLRMDNFTITGEKL